VSERLPTVAASTAVYGDGVAVDDPAEAYHEASRLDPSTALARLPGLALLESDPFVHASADRSSRLHAHRQSVELAAVSLPRVSLSTVLERRRSGLGARAGSIARDELGAVLGAAYGSRCGDVRRRRVPSAGALYPLELYVAARSLSDVAPGLYHFDPFAHRLERLREVVPEPELAAALVEPALLEGTAALLAITAVFWRTRFKYGQRGYRFALLEAGHVVQNALLAAAACGLPSLPVGGFYDRDLDRVLDVDGLDEASLYVVLLGGRT